VPSQTPLATTSYFDDRPDARFFVTAVDGVVVSIRKNLPTYGVTDGEVWAAWRSHDQLVEHRFANTNDARRRLGQIVRGRDDLPLIVAWTSIPRAEYAVACSICEAAFGQPCIGDGAPLLASKGHATIVGAPWQPAPHDVEVDLVPLVHAGRITRYFQSLHGERGARA